MEKSGPNLDGVGDKFTRAQLVQEVLHPSLAIKPGFEQAVILTTEGRTLTGRLERATKLAVRLIDTQGKQHNINRNDIEELKFSPQSLMPDNTVAW